MDILKNDQYYWKAQQGIQKLGIQDSDLTNRLLQDPKGKQLLIQASDLAPGSKAMQRIQDQIKKGWGSKWIYLRSLFKDIST